MGARAIATCLKYSGKPFRYRLKMSLPDNTSGTLKTLPPLGSNMNPRISIVRMGQRRHSATRPKLSSSVVLSPLTKERPKPRAITKGTIMGPVVTPPDSKAMETILVLVKAERIKATA